jgi:hypothetical protein
MDRFVFVSCSTFDRATAEQLVQLLEGSGFKCWIRFRDLPAGQLYGRAIEDAIAASEAVILVVSDNALRASAIKYEVECAKQHSLPLVPVRLGPKSAIDGPLRDFIGVTSAPVIVESDAPDDGFRETLLSALRSALETGPTYRAGVAAQARSMAPRAPELPPAPTLRPRIMPPGWSAPPVLGRRETEAPAQKPEMPPSVEAPRTPSAVEKLESPRAAKPNRPRAVEKPTRPDAVEKPESPVVAEKPKTDRIDKVQFSAFAPRCVFPGSEFVLEIWAFLKHQRAEAIERASGSGTRLAVGSKGPVRIQRGSDLTVWVNIPCFRIEQTTDVIQWDGEIANASFSVTAPDGFDHKTYLGKAKVICNGVQIAQLIFEIAVGLNQTVNTELRCDSRKVQSVFASYASEDRETVLQWKRTADALGVDVFVDVLSLRAGDNWASELWNEIPKRDLFWLFWSEHASRSEWVEKEWRCALNARDCDYIHPVPLADPRIVQPPAELKGCAHFEDVTRIVAEYEKAFRLQALK